MSFPLLTTKLHAPQLPPVLVPRPRLLALLDDDFARRRVTLVSAPAGYGKSTLAAHWIERQRSRAASPCFAWYAVEAVDGPDGRFLTYLSTALHDVAPSTYQSYQAALATAPAPDAAFAEREALLIELVDELEDACRPIVLVLDDCHSIQRAADHAALAFLCTHLPSTLYLLLLTRVDPPLPTALLRGRGQLRELRQQDLALTEVESNAFLDAAGAHQLHTPGRRRLVALTEGWIAGLQMAALALQNQPVSGEVTAETGDGERQMNAFFEQEVLALQPPVVARILRRTSILNRINQELMAAVAGPLPPAEADGVVPDSPHALQLDDLETSNLFIVALDAEHTWYRYHHLFRKALQHRLHEEEPEVIPALHRRASQWFVSHGYREEAIDHALAGADYALAVPLIAETAEPMLKRGDAITLQRWLTVIPDSLLMTQPQLLTYRGAVRLLDEQPQQLVEADLDAALAAPPDSTARAAAMTLRGLVASQQGRSAAGHKLLLEGLAQLPEQASFWRGLTVSMLGLNYFAQGDLPHAYTALLEALDLAEHTEDRMNAVIALCHLGGVAVMECRLDEAQHHYESALALATDSGEHHPLAGMPYVGRGLLHLERGTFSEAVAQLQKGLALLHDWGSAGTLHAELWLAAAHVLRLEWSRADEALHRARRLATRSCAASAEGELVDRARVQLSLARRDLGPARAWLDRQMMQPLWMFLPDAAQRSRDRELYAPAKTLLMARICLDEGRPKTALSLLAAQAEAMPAPLPPRTQIEVHLTEALALHALERPFEAQQRLSVALALAAPCAVVRPFMEQSLDGVFDLLVARPLDANRADFTTMLQARLKSTMAGSRLPALPDGVPEPIAESGKAAGRSDDMEAVLLTAREHEVLLLIAGGLTNREIAARLVVSLSTVKTHINNLYRKLAVRSRTTALAKAHRAGLI